MTIQLEKLLRFQVHSVKRLFVLLGSVAESSSASIGPCEQRGTRGLIWKGHSWPDQQKIKIFRVKFNRGTAKCGMEITAIYSHFLQFPKFIRLPILTTVLVKVKCSLLSCIPCCI